MRVTVENLTTGHRGQRAVLEKLNLNVECGQRTAVLGSSAAGKSTLLLTIAGFQSPWSGSVTIGDQLVADGKTWVPPERREISMLFQDLGLWPHLTVREHLQFVLEAKRVARSERAARIDRLLDETRLTSCASRTPGSLSGGEAQRLALARALVAQPQVLLLDEPLGSLDRALHQEMLDLVDTLTRDTTVILVTHDVAEANGLASELAILVDGAIPQQGPYHEIYSRPCSAEAARITGEAALLPVVVNGDHAETPIGVVNIDTSTRGDSVLIRPHHVRLESDGRFEARVRRCTPMGSGWSVTLAMGDETIRIRTSKPRPVGDSVHFHLDAPLVRV